MIFALVGNFITVSHEQEVSKHHEAWLPQCEVGMMMMVVLKVMIVNIMMVMMVIIVMFMMVMVILMI